MKKLIPILAAAMLLSCRAQKAATDTEQRSTMSYVDTTKVVADTAGHKQTDTDTTKTAAAYEGAALVEFVDSGGKVTVGTAGNITFEGVKRIKGRYKGAVVRNAGVGHESEQAAGRREQLSGVKAGQTKQEKRTEEKAPAQKWYQTAFARIGQGVCIAALMWLLFLYRKRKK